MTFIRIHYKRFGGHYHCRLFTTQTKDGTYAKCGDLVFDEHEWADIKNKLSAIEFMEDK